MSNHSFIHLRLHTAYSLSEGAIHVKALPKLCTQHNMPAVAITDTNNMFGMLEASLTLPGSGIQPIVGCCLSITHGPEELQGTVRRPEPGSIALLAQTDQGYHNLMELVSQAHLESAVHEPPQIGLSLLEGKTDGVICLSGGHKGPIGKYLLDEDEEKAAEVTRKLMALFPGRLYMELMRHGMSEEEQCEDKLLDLAYAHDIPLVATNDVHFPTRNMYAAHDALLCIADGAYVEQDDRRKLTPEHYFKSPDEMARLFEDLPEAITNTVVVAQRCAYKVPTIDPILPKFTADENTSEAETLRQFATKGLEARLEAHVFTGDETPEEREEKAKPYFDRLDYELGIIINMDFPGYFLIVSDFIQWSKDHNIPVGPGRGSGAGSVVAWALLITDLDPLRFSLLFERFLNPERVSMPDFDIDFCQDKRDQVIKYVQDKYGHDQVAQIITFGKLQARAVVRDVGRVLQMPYGQVDRLSKMIPSNPANPVTLSEALESEERLQAERDSDPTTARLIDMALQLEGLYRHASTHAAGVVIGDRPLHQLVPLYRDPKSDMPVTQFNMKFVEQAGLVKFDFLGLKTLTVLAKAVENIRPRGIDIDLSQVPLDDKPSFELMGRGKTVGVFQLESSGMQNVLLQMKPDLFEDIIAVVALYRPGPMDNIPRYIACKHGEEEPDYLHPLLVEVLKETYGVIIYQEQVMQIAQILADYSLGEADLLRRAMGKKIAAEMDKQRARFQEGADNKGVDPKQAAHIFDLVAKFAGYGFNKSHAAAYALVAYHTAYLKANFPVEFMAAIMSLDLNNTDKLQIFKEELKSLHIPILPPDVNKSQVEFSVEVIEGERDDEHIGGARGDGVLRGVRYALAGLKNVGSAAMESLVAEREKNGPFKSLEDFCARIDTHHINKRALENMAKAGAFDSINPNRAQVFQSVEMLLKQASAATQERNSDQVSLFGDVVEEPNLVLPDVNDWALIDRLNNEREAIGFYLSAHPLDAYDKVLARQKVVPSSEIEARATGKGGVVKLAGTIQSLKEKRSQRGNKYAFLGLSDAAGAYEVTLFSEVLNAKRDMLEAGNSVIVTAEVRKTDEGAVRLTAQGIESIDQVAARTAKGLEIFVENEKSLTAVKEILEQHKGGRGTVTFKIKVDDGEKFDIDVELGEGYVISPAVRNAIVTMKGITEAREI
ncbi:DNA polymerase III subunit alpha [Emcibacter nanhaiensis]|uniref:DNA polymerase III subunit alpha n=1 Tax=Emcibacter nanhaiensis TaxID=1505037 RepID=A0A501PS58_9PROT|nr:DNA polymerase III subunit alpha [Emcibacter nanhaiensis]TPD62902.1 DNA polymerase III subunit alpha [Emcibacter nanhaiensis]